MQADELSERIGKRYAELPAVAAVVMGGSRASGSADDRSDIDLYIYCRRELTLQERAACAGPDALHVEIGNDWWEPGDEWVDPHSGLHVDVMFRTVEWIEDRIDSLLIRHQPSTGYSTCLWFNVASARSLFDRTGWFETLQKRCREPYPEELRRRIIQRNYPLLRQNLSSYLHQITLAVQRRDLVALNHRVAALLASYFDILFALNRLPHPGEKRLIAHAVQTCALLPDRFPESVELLLEAADAEPQRVEACAVELIDALDRLLHLWT